MRFSIGSYNIQVKGIRSCRQLKVVPKKYSRLSVRWILVRENRKDPWIRIARQDILIFLHVYSIIDYNNIIHAISIENNEY